MDSSCHVPSFDPHGKGKVHPTPLRPFQIIDEVLNSSPRVFFPVSEDMWQMHYPPLREIDQRRECFRLKRHGIERERDEISGGPRAPCNSWVNNLEVFDSLRRPA